MRMWYLPALAVSALVLGGCDTDGDTGVNVEQKPNSGFVVRYVPTMQDRDQVPYPNDIFLAAASTFRSSTRWTVTRSMRPPK